MEDLSPADDTPPDSPMPEAGNDPADPLRPEVDEDDIAATPPLADPHLDMDATEEADPQTATIGFDDDAADDSDEESALSEIDEAQFEDFDPAAIAIEERPVAIDEGNVNLLKSHKRKRVDGEDATEKRRKKKEGRREKVRKARKPRGSEDDFSGGEEIEGKRQRKNKDFTERKERRAARPRSPENDENLTPEERRRRALDRKMDEALKGPSRQRKRMGGIDLEAQNDELIENMRRRMADAAKADGEARDAGKPAMHKLKLLPEVVALLNRNNLRDQLVDPETNLLQAVRFFLEPLNDGSLPAYNIQRALFAALANLPIGKDSLVASGIGKVTLFYTKSKQPEPSIKRQAERLLGEWTRPILKRSNDYRKREFLEVNYDPNAAPRNVISDPAASAEAARRAARERQLATPNLTNRARADETLRSYHVVPRSNIGSVGQYRRPIGAGGEEAFRKLKQRQMANRA